ncbi:MAG: hypothetical protein RBS43_10215 [Candidatus Cloacimonas sp.]|nr:hypothetical protein [Candidatus Cloacimonas sp.]
MKDNKILMIINEFPPTGQSGVQRALKFLKYNVAAGWDVHVIAPLGSVRKITDYSLLKEIPPTCHLHRVGGLGIKTVSESKMVHARFPATAPKSPVSRLYWQVLKLINDLLFPYDKQIGWMPFALLKATILIKRYKIRNVYITAFPYSAFLVGIALKLLYGKRIFWVADYRDSWQFAPSIERYMLPFRRKIVTGTDDIVLKKCDTALFVTKYIHEQYCQKHPWLKDKSAVITNGYDEADFKQLQPKLYDCFTFAYMGKMHVNYGNPLPLLTAIAGCNLGKFQFVHIGSADETVLESIGKAGFDFYKFEGYKPHAEALNYSAGADVNLIILSDDRGSEHVYTGKLFELLRLGKPILAVGPKKCIIAEVLQETGLGRYAWIGDVEQIQQQLNLLLMDSGDRIIDISKIQKYSRQALSAQLLKLFATD